MPAVNIQALVALGLFLLSLAVARMVNNITSGKWPGNEAWVIYLRMLLGFLFTGSIVLGFYSFAGKNILF